jgi:hypothetical protein
MTVTESAPAGHAADPSLLAPGQVRRSALSCIVTGTTPEDLRVRAVRACGDLEPVWRAWAAEIETLAARGLTGQSAREAAKIALAEEIAADGLRQGAAAPLTAPARSRRLTAVADQMDALLAEGFNGAAYRRELERKFGSGAR